MIPSQFWPLFVLAWALPRGSAQSAEVSLSMSTMPDSDPDDEVWRPSETDENWVEYPSLLEPRVQDDKTVLSPVDMTVYQTYPEPAEARIWPLLKGMVRRMDGLLKPGVAYYLQSGEELGCRHTFLNGTEVAVAAGRCHRHCTHSGRYCAPHNEYYHGRHVVQEVARRLCLAKYLPSLTTYPLYLQEFEHQSCMNASHLNLHNCSRDAMAIVGIDVSIGTDLNQCMEPDWWSDDDHVVLADNLEHFTQETQVSSSWNSTSQIELDGRPLMPELDGPRDWTALDIFGNYCSAFPNCEGGLSTKPLACQVCGDCSDVQTCLWTLQCDGNHALTESRIQEIAMSDANCVSPSSTSGSPTTQTSPTTEAPSPSPTTGAPTMPGPTIATGHPIATPTTNHPTTGFPTTTPTASPATTRSPTGSQSSGESPTKPVRTTAAPTAAAPTVAAPTTTAAPTIDDINVNSDQKATNTGTQSQLESDSLLTPIVLCVFIAVLLTSIVWCWRRQRHQQKDKLLQMSIEEERAGDSDCYEYSAHGSGNWGEKRSARTDVFLKEDELDAVSFDSVNRFLEQNPSVPPQEGFQTINLNNRPAGEDFWV